jgi:nitrous oxidase accessory protein NosD
MMGLCLTSFSLLTAKVIEVREGEDLQQIINEADSGDILELHGTFTGSFVIDQKELTLAGPGRNPATLEGSSGPVLLVKGFKTIPEGQKQIDVSLENLIITKGRNDNGGGIFNQFANLDLSFVTIRNNHATTTGGGIASLGGEIDIKHSKIANNEAGGIGGGINSLGAKLSIKHSDIIENTAQTGGGGGIVVNAGKIDIKYSNIARNHSGLGGGGIDNEAGSETEISHCTVHNNTAVIGAGLYNSATLIVEHSTISDNKASSKGGGLYNAKPAVIASLKHSEVTTNSAGNLENPGSGGGIFNAAADSSLVRKKTKVTGNFPDNITQG